MKNKFDKFEKLYQTLASCLTLKLISCCYTFRMTSVQIKEEFLETFSSKPLEQMKREVKEELISEAHGT